jgi:protein TonB
MQAVNGNNHSPHESQALGRGGRALLVIGAHVVVVYLIATSLGIVKAPSFVKPMEASIIDAPQQDQPKPVEVVKPEMEQPQLDVPQDTLPIPEVEIPVETPTESTMAAAPVQAVESTELAVSNRVAPAYPPASRRAGEQGVVQFRILVDERGKPLEVNVLKSSGFPRLDEAAAAAIRKWTFVPPTRNGAKVQSWSRVAVRFELNAA